MTLRYRIRIGAPLPDGVAIEIERRFGLVGTHTVRNGQSSLRGLVADQSALRGLLALLWDLNAELISLYARPEAHQP